MTKIIISATVSGRAWSRERSRQLTAGPPARPAFHSRTGSPQAAATSLSCGPATRSSVASIKLGNDAPGSSGAKTYPCAARDAADPRRQGHLLKVSTPSATISIRMLWARSTGVSMIVIELRSIPMASMNIFVDLDDIADAELEEPARTAHGRCRRHRAPCALRASATWRKDKAPNLGQVLDRLPLGELKDDLRKPHRPAEDIPHIAHDAVVLEMPGCEVEPNLERCCRSTEMPD